MENDDQIATGEPQTKITIKDCGRNDLSTRLFKSRNRLATAIYHQNRASKNGSTSPVRVVLEQNVPEALTIVELETKFHFLKENIKSLPQAKDLLEKIEREMPSIKSSDNLFGNFLEKEGVVVPASEQIEKIEKENSEHPLCVVVDDLIKAKEVLASLILVKLLNRYGDHLPNGARLLENAELQMDKVCEGIGRRTKVRIRETKSNNNTDNQN